MPTSRMTRATLQWGLLNHGETVIHYKREGVTAATARSRAYEAAKAAGLKVTTTDAGGQLIIRLSKEHRRSA